MKPIDHTTIKPGRFGHLPSRRPCIECPLRRDAKPGALGGYSAIQYLEVLHGAADLACHLSPGFPHDLAQSRPCTGVAMYRANLGLVPWGHAREAVAFIGRDVRAVFASAAEFFHHHNTPD